MGRKSYQSGDKYARQGTQPKKRRPRKPAPQMNTGAAPLQRNSTEATPISATRTDSGTPKRGASTVAASTYEYIIPDLKRTGIFAAAAFIILIILAITLT